MTRATHLRLVTAVPALERSVTVQDAAAALSLDPSTIREMVRTGKLRGHRAGAKDRAVRIYVSSIDSYRESQEIVPTEKSKAPEKKRRGPSAADLEALAYLRELGVA